MAQEQQAATVNLDKLCLTTQDFNHLWQQALDFFYFVAMETASFVSNFAGGFLHNSRR